MDAATFMRIAHGLCGRAVPPAGMVAFV